MRLYPIFLKCESRIGCVIFRMVIGNPPRHEIFSVWGGSRQLAILFRSLQNRPTHFMDEKYSELTFMCYSSVYSCKVIRILFVLHLASWKLKTHQPDNQHDHENPNEVMWENYWLNRFLIMFLYIVDLLHHIYDIHAFYFIRTLRFELGFWFLFL